MHERALISRLRARQAAAPEGMLGMGDDCCIWSQSGPQCLSVDSLVEGRHFRADDDPRLIGGKAAAAALSDLAAMGAVPIGAAVALHLPARWDAEALMDGLCAVCETYACPLLGGDTCGAEELVIAVTVWGHQVADGTLLRRDGAQPGDLLLVSGALGGSLASGRHLRPQPRLAEGQWLARRAFVHALMDISDGLAADVRRLAEASGVGVQLLGDRLPIHDDVPQLCNRARAACCDGEDYELLVAIDAASWPTLQASWPFTTPLHEVGWCLPGAEILFEDPIHGLGPLAWDGYEHHT